MEIRDVSHVHIVRYTPTQYKSRATGAASCALYWNLTEKREQKESQILSRELLKSVHN